MENKVFSLINYVGHKSKILDQVLSCFPDSIDGTFWDIFCGSSVVGLSANFKKVNFVDNNQHLVNLYSHLRDEDFLATLESMIEEYNLTNSSKKPRSEYLKDPRIGVCTWQGEKIKNLHLDKLNEAGYRELLDKYNTLNMRGVDAAAAYMILTLYGRNSNVSIKKDGKLSGGVGPLDFSIKARKKYFEHLDVMKGRDLNWVHGSFSDINPEEGDFVYLDPPYLASGYKYGGWKEKDETDLLDWIDSLSCPWALSNTLASGDKENKLLMKWSKKYKVIPVEKKYRVWASKKEGTAKREKKRNLEVLIVPAELSSVCKVA